MTFEDRIAETVKSKLSDGTVEEIISKKLEEGIAEVINDLFRYSGKGKEIIKEKFNEVMLPAIEGHDFNQYVIKLDAVLTEVINNTSLTENKKVLTSFRDLMKEPECNEIKISKIFENYCEHASLNVSTSNLEARCDDNEPHYSSVEVTMEVNSPDYRFETHYNNCYVEFCCEEDERLNYRLNLFKGVQEDKWIIRDCEFSSLEINSLRNISEFEIFLHTLKQGFVKIELDVKNDYDEVEPKEQPEWYLS